MKRYRLLAAGVIIGLAVTACGSATRRAACRRPRSRRHPHRHRWRPAPSGSTAPTTGRTNRPTTSSPARTRAASCSIWRGRAGPRSRRSRPGSMNSTTAHPTARRGSSSNIPSSSRCGAASRYPGSLASGTSPGSRCATPGRDHPRTPATGSSSGTRRNGRSRSVRSGPDGPRQNLDRRPPLFVECRLTPSYPASTFHPTGLAPVDREIQRMSLCTRSFRYRVTLSGSRWR